MTLFEFIVLGLATWRVSSLLVDERGPFDIFIRLRGLVGIENDQDGIPTLIPDGFLPGILSCVWCCSVWVAGFWVVFWSLIPDVSILCGEVLALSALAIILNKHAV